MGRWEQGGKLTSKPLLLLLLANLLSDKWVISGRRQGKTARELN